MKLNKISGLLLSILVPLSLSIDALALSNIQTADAGTHLDSIANIDALEKFDAAGTTAKEIKQPANLRLNTNDEVSFDWAENGNGNTDVHKFIASQIYKAIIKESTDTLNTAKFNKLSMRAPARALQLGHPKLARVFAVIAATNGKIAPNNVKLVFGKLGIPDTFLSDHKLQPTSSIDDVLEALTTINASAGAQPGTKPYLEFDSTEDRDAVKAAGDQYDSIKYYIEEQFNEVFSGIYEETRTAIDKGLLAAHKATAK